MSSAGDTLALPGWCSSLTKTRLKRNYLSF